MADNPDFASWMPIVIQAYRCPDCNHRNDMRKRKGWADFYSGHITSNAANVTVTQNNAQ